MLNPKTIHLATAIGLAVAIIAAPLARAVEKAPAPPPVSPAASTPLKKLDIGPKKPPIVPADKPATTNKVAVPAAAKP